MSAAASDFEAAGAPSLLDVLGRAPAAAALVVGALSSEERQALRLVCTQTRDAVGEATTKIVMRLYVPAAAAAAAARPPASRRWPRLEELMILCTSSALAAVIEAVGAETWGHLHKLELGLAFIDSRGKSTTLGVPCVQAVTAALRRMPALRALTLNGTRLSDEASEALFHPSSGVPQLRAFTFSLSRLSPAAARALAATGWRLEELDLQDNPTLGPAGIAALVAAPTFAIRRLKMDYCRLDATALLAVANSPWPLEELDLSHNDFRAAAAGPALAAHSTRARLRKLDVSYCRLSAASFKALVEAAWPALTHLDARKASVKFDGPDALGAAAFEGFPALEELDLSEVKLREAGAQLLAARRWARIKKLNLNDTRLGDAGVAALARGAWPALEVLDLRNNSLGAPLALDNARRWAPALVQLLQ